VKWHCTSCNAIYMKFLNKCQGKSEEERKHSVMSARDRHCERSEAIS
jgi:hypothetical protein